jgi:transposase-like protein
MPWSQLSPMDQKTQFIADYLRRSLSVTELCEHYGISRKTGYKWIERYEHGGLQPGRALPTPACVHDPHARGAGAGAH